MLLKYINNEITEKIVMQIAKLFLNLTNIGEILKTKNPLLYKNH